MMSKNLETLETALFDLLENHQLEDIIFGLFSYADIQASLAKTLQQTEAAAKWKHTAHEIGSIRLWQQSYAPQSSGIKVISSN